jgi:hypothetical protein
MLSIKQKSKRARITHVLLALLLASAAAMAVPAVVLAEPAEEPQPPQLSFDPGSYDFGLQPVNNGSGQASFQLRNTGTEAVQVNSVEISGPGSEAFWIGFNGCNVTLQPNETCFVQVYFSPRDATEYAVQLRANAGPYSFTADLSGTGGRAILAPAFNPTDFGVAAVGSAGTTREIMVTNEGNMPGGVFIAVISGGAVGSFQLLDENCTGHPLAPAAPCTLQVRFRPLSEGVKTATLSLFGEQDGGTQVILTGVGAVPVPATSTPPAANGVAPVGTVSGPADRPRARPHHRRRSRVWRRHRRAALHSASRVLGADLGSGREGR